MQIPPVAECVLEREEPHKLVVTQLLAVPNTRVALLGMGGIGKTTLACHIARDPQVDGKTDLSKGPRKQVLSSQCLVVLAQNCSRNARTFLED